MQDNQAIISHHLGMVIEAMGLQDREARIAAIQHAVDTLPPLEEQAKPIDLHSCRLPDGWCILDGCVYTSGFEFLGYSKGFVDLHDRRMIRDGKNPLDWRNRFHPDYPGVYAWEPVPREDGERRA